MSGRKARSAFVVSTVTRDQHGETLKLTAISHEHSARVPDGQKFTEYTPSGTLDIRIVNPALRGAFEPGECYWLDLTLIESA